MDDYRPLKGNSSGKYNMNFIDPTNDICAYYNGMTELEEIVVRFMSSRNNILILSLGIPSKKLKHNPAKSMIKMLNNNIFLITAQFASKNLHKVPIP